MNNNNLFFVQEYIFSQSFVDFLKLIDVEEFFNLRDSEEFDSEWISNFNRLEKEKLLEKDRKIIDSLRENSFKLAYKITKDSDISAYISDDFEIIAKDILLGNKNTWTIIYLWEYYKSTSNNRTLHKV